MNIESIRTHVEHSVNVCREHPFTQAAHRRSLTREQSLRWIYCAGRESQSFPHILLNMLSWTHDPTVREILEENLEDELGHGNLEDAHFSHYIQLLEQLGLGTELFMNYDAREGVQLALSLAHNVANSRNVGRALGYMLVNEAMTPVTYTAARSTLTHYFPEVKTDFFDMHIAVDEHHVEELYRAAQQLTADDEFDVLYGIALGERGMTVLLDEAFGAYHELSELDLPGLLSDEFDSLYASIPRDALNA